jgi:hypothetical protein
MASSRSFGDEWLAFSSVVYAPPVGAVQREECRRAFYAGGYSLLHLIMAMLDPGQEPTPRDIEKMTALERELEAHFDELRELGRAGR